MQATTLIKNSWYVAALSGELTHIGPLGRMIAGESLVMFRRRDGKVVAFEDRCPHRRMPLSAGRLTEDDKLICAYHGLTFDDCGKCVLIPGQATIPDLRIRSYPVHERAGLVWVWTGPAEKAKVQDIFDTSWLERTGWNVTPFYRYAKANYLLLNDNLADLLHVAYLHIPSGGGNEQMGAAELEFKPNPSGFTARRVSRDIRAPVAYGRMANPAGNVDRWHVAEFQAPCFHRIHTGVSETGTGVEESILPIGRGRWSIAPHHFVTPETEKTTHYFQLIAHEWTQSSDAWKMMNSVVDEDVWAIERQQTSIDLAPDAPTFAIGSDGPMLAMRRVIERRITEEQQAMSAS